MAEEQSFVAEVTHIQEKTGPGGGITLVELKLLHSKRPLSRAVRGSVKIGDLITILDEEREHKRR